MTTGTLPRRPEVILWDFNGTLYDDINTAYGSVVKIFTTYGLAVPSLDAYRNEIGANFMEFYYNHGFPRTTTADELNAIRRAYYKSAHDQGRFRPDVRTMLQWLLVRGYGVGIVSAEIGLTLHQLLIRNGLSRMFDYIKPEAWGDKAKYLAEAAEVFGKKPEDVVYVDDTEDGLNAAARAGLIPVAMNNATAYNSQDRLMSATSISIKEPLWLSRLLPA